MVVSCSDPKVIISKIPNQLDTSGIKVELVALKELAEQYAHSQRPHQIIDVFFFKMILNFLANY
jgi:hypothetical protein